MKIDRCYNEINQCLAQDQSIHRLLNALKENGCPFHINRHFRCENSSSNNIRGGFNRQHCQIIIFADKVDSNSEACRIFRHELIHAYDYCRNELDFNDPKHLACTEIRAARLSDECSFFRYLSTSNRPFRWKNQHRQCVRERAKESMRVFPHFSSKHIEQIMNDVFDRCYNDTNPFDDDRP